MLDVSRTPRIRLYLVFSFTLLCAVIGVMKVQSSALVVNLRQKVAEAEENTSKEPEEVEIELCRTLVDGSHRTFKKINEMKKHYEIKRKEFTSLETVNFEQVYHRFIKGTRDANNCTTQNVANVGMNQQTPRHHPDN